MRASIRLNGRHTRRIPVAMAEEHLCGLDSMDSSPSMTMKLSASVSCEGLCQNLQAQKERIVASSIWNGIPMWKTVPTTPGVLYWYEPSTQLLTTSKYTDLASSSITVCIASSLFANHEELQSLLDFFIAINPDNQQPGDCGTSRRTHQQHDYMCGSYWCNF